MEWWQLVVQHADKLPFIAAVNGSHMRVQLSYQRVFEAAIIGAVLAVIGYITIIPRLEERLSLEIRHVREDIQRLERRVETIDMQRQQDYKELQRKNGGRP